MVRARRSRSGAVVTISQLIEKLTRLAPTLPIGTEVHLMVEIGDDPVDGWVVAEATNVTVIPPPNPRYFSEVWIEGVAKK